MTDSSPQSLCPRAFGPVPIGSDVLELDEVTSTNDLAREYVRHRDCDGLVIRARHQRAGHGRFGRNWVVPAGAGLLVSVVFSAATFPAGGRSLTALGAIAVVEAVNGLLRSIEARGHLRVEPHRGEIHWPNDVYLLGRKLAGVLVEQACGGEGPAWIVGIGINVRGRIPEVPEAITLEEACRGTVSVDEVARRLYARLEVWAGRVRSGGIKRLGSVWRTSSGLVSRKVRLRHAGQSLTGTVLDVRPESGLRLMTHDGREVVVVAEKTSHVEILG